MIYCFICKDGPNAEVIRQQELEAHLAHIEDVIDHIRVAGPIPADGGGYCGSIIMIEAESHDEAQALFDKDPYAKAKIWESIELLPFSGVAGTWVGGVTWKKQ